SESPSLSDSLPIKKNIGSSLIRPAPSTSVCPGQRRLIHPPVQALLMLVLQDAEPALFSPNATLLDPAEWRRDRKLLVSVDPHRACLEGTRHAPCAFVIAGPDAGGETVDAVVRSRDQIGLVAEREHHKYRTKDFLLADRLVIRQAVEDSRLVEPAMIIESTLRSLAADQHLAAFVEPEPHKTFNRFAMLCRDERTHLRARVLRV